MMGPNHMIVNMETAVVTGIACRKAADMASQVEALVPLSQAMHRGMTWVWLSVFPSTGSMLRMVASGSVAVILFLLGSLLPDIDTKKSTIGRYVHIPLRHRTWTHAVWIPALMFLIGLRISVVMWLSLGYFGHLFWDSLSKGGICWFYPFQRYIEYESGAFVARGHWVKLYRSGDVREYVIVGLMTVLMVLCIIWALV